MSEMDRLHLARELLQESLGVIQGLADQQAMPDNFYVETIYKIEDFLRGI